MAHTLVSREQLLLKSRKKWTVNGTSRIKPAQETFIEVTALAKKIGVTRLADITDMVYYAYRITLQFYLG